jgi:hypothetical protein
MNHLRVPYRETIFSEVESSAPCGHAGEVLILIGCPNDAVPPLADGARSLTVSAVDAEKLLPWNDGLCSDAAADLIARLAGVADFPLVTGMLPPLAGLRVDDVTGEGGAKWLDAVLKRGWKPNLGLFIRDFAKRTDAAMRNKFADAGRNGCLEFSPHAFTATEFLFYDYPNARAYSEGEFLERWRRVKADMAGWGFPISPVINAHFHALSPEAVGPLTNDGCAYFYSELAPGAASCVPSPADLPSGDPLFTTGQKEETGILRIYSGDSALDCNQPGSLYDFMMHAKPGDAERAPARRLFKRLQMTLSCGFASFATAHEYLLNALSPREREDLWDEAAAAFSQAGMPQLRHATLSEIGASCREHANVVIRSVGKRPSGGLCVTLSGSSGGRGELSVFVRGERRFCPIPAFAGETTLDLAF